MTIPKHAHIANNFLRYTCSLVAACAFTIACTAQDATPPSLSFEQAREQLATNAPLLKAAQAAYSGKKDTAASLKSLNYPDLKFDLSYLTYETTIKNSEFTIDKLELNGTSLPVDALNDTPLKVKLSQDAIRPIVSTQWVLYSGGQISATRKAATALADQAGSQVEVVHEALELQLVQFYFGQQLATRVLALRKDLLDGMQEHLDNAIKLEDAGVTTKAQRLNAQVAHASARRAHDSAKHSLENAKIALAALLHSTEPVNPTTSLFILMESTGERGDFVSSARNHSPQVRAHEALERAASEGANAERARWMPKVFAFGDYNLYRNGKSLVDPDWSAGVGMQWSVFDKIDRRKSYSAAKQSVRQAAEALEHARMSADSEARQAFDAIANAQQQFELLENDLESARENVRVQELSFREGQGISTDVTNARIALTNVLVERAVAAYQFDVELARLLHASGQMSKFIEYMNDPDVIVP